MGIEFRFLLFYCLSFLIEQASGKVWNIIDFRIYHTYIETLWNVWVSRNEANEQPKEKATLLNRMVLVCVLVLFRTNLKRIVQFWVILLRLAILVIDLTIFQQWNRNGYNTIGFAKIHPLCIKSKVLYSQGTERIITASNTHTHTKRTENKCRNVKRQRNGGRRKVRRILTIYIPQPTVSVYIILYIHLCRFVCL